MEQLNRLLNEKNLPIESLPATPLPTDLNEKQGPKWKLYVSTVTRVVLKTINWANAPALTEQELGLRVKDWADFLWPYIPEDRLLECVDLVGDSHDGGFPLSAYEIRAAWKVVQAKDAAKLEKQKEALRESNPIDHCDMKSNHVNELGEIEILYGGPGGIEANVPCPFCRMDANAQAMSNLAERLKAKQPSNVKAFGR